MLHTHFMSIAIHTETKLRGTKNEPTVENGENGGWIKLKTKS